MHAVVGGSGAPRHHQPLLLVTPHDQNQYGCVLRSKTAQYGLHTLDANAQNMIYAFTGKLGATWGRIFLSPLSDTKRVVKQANDKNVASTRIRLFWCAQV